VLNYNLSTIFEWLASGAVVGINSVGTQPVIKHDLRCFEGILSILAPVLDDLIHVVEPCVVVPPCATSNRRAMDWHQETNVEDIDDRYVLVWLAF